MFLISSKALICKSQNTLTILYSFVISAKVQHEKLSKLLENMERLYQSIMEYYAIDVKKVSVEDFFSDLSNFRTTFMVW
jgi:diaphanous 3